MAAYSLIGTDESGFGHVEVHNPTAGTWTAVIFTVSNAPTSGRCSFAYSTDQFHSVGSVTPSSLTLAPGQQGTFHVSITAGQAGDDSLSLHLGTGGSNDGSIPIVLRSLAPLSRNGGAFSGNLTGGGASFNAIVASAPYSPLTLAPGQTGTITLTITQNAPKGKWCAASSASIRSIWPPPAGTS